MTLLKKSSLNIRIKKDNDSKKRTGAFLHPAHDFFVTQQQEFLQLLQRFQLRVQL